MDQSGAAEDRVRRVVEASPTALILVDCGGTITLVNRQAERMFGYGHDEMLHAQLDILLPDRFAPLHAGHLTGFFGQSSVRQMGIGRELYGRRKDGSEFPLEIGLNPLTLDDQPMVLAGVIDVTARHDFERAQLQRQRDLERSNADLEEFAYVASHDLKAPLRAVGHLAEWITEDVQAVANEETLENLKLLKSRVQRLQMLLEGLLQYSRIGRGKLPPEEVDVAELVGDIAALHGAAPGFDVRFEGPLQVLHTYRTPLRAVLENLIGNALKHHDRREGSIRVGMRQADDMVAFSVADDGPGIAPRYHERIFQIFQTVAGGDERQTGGIGLAIAKKQVGVHGGTIRVESDPPNRGAIFFFDWREGAA